MNTNTDLADWTDYSRLKKADQYYNVGKEDTDNGWRHGQQHLTPILWPLVKLKAKTC